MDLTHHVRQFHEFDEYDGSFARLIGTHGKKCPGHGGKRPVLALCLSESHNGLCRTRDPDLSVKCLIRQIIPPDKVSRSLRLPPIRRMKQVFDKSDS